MIDFPRVGFGRYSVLFIERIWHRRSSVSTPCRKLLSRRRRCHRLLIDWFGEGKLLLRLLWLLGLLILLTELNILCPWLCMILLHCWLMMKLWWSGVLRVCIAPGWLYYWW